MAIALEDLLAGTNGDKRSALRCIAPDGRIFEVVSFSVEGDAVWLELNPVIEVDPEEPCC